ncbi:tRNA pseudouridine(38-40) synthase TruA [candidate division TM6 bacterium RIFCSPHIGHO2_12_FULL_32_22]|nr:MAG: tRNA pseudouridine(38-40) synthase TruA [candidate division TM6 bacterium RIFCSPHIGHO2_12_FULL_32_22]
MYYKLIIAYDGTNYQGWQEQKSGSTIAGTLKNIFKHVFQKDISMVGASRTDAGVHANHQVARIKTDLKINATQLKNAWSRGIPEDILIKSLTKTTTSFHPQKNVKQKTYVYKIFLQKPSPFVQRYGYYLDFEIDIKKLKNALKVFVGKHDFRSFCTGYEMDSTIRTIDSITVRNIKSEKALEVIIKGESFLRYMIRRIVGAAIEVASRKKLDEEVLIKALKEKNPQQRLPTAPAKGLTLFKIEYNR